MIKTYKKLWLEFFFVIIISKFMMRPTDTNTHTHVYIYIYIYIYIYCSEVNEDTDTNDGVYQQNPRRVIYVNREVEIRRSVQVRWVLVVMVSVNGQVLSQTLWRWRETRVRLSSREHVIHVCVVFLPALKLLLVSSRCTGHYAQVFLVGN